MARAKKLRNVAKNVRKSTQPVMKSNTAVQAGQSVISAATTANRKTEKVRARKARKVQQRAAKRAATKQANHQPVSPFKEPTSKVANPQFNAPNPRVSGGYERGAKGRHYNNEAPAPVRPVSPFQEPTSKVANPQFNAPNPRVNNPNTQANKPNPRSNKTTRQYNEDVVPQGKIAIEKRAQEAKENAERVARYQNEMEGGRSRARRVEGYHAGIEGGRQRIADKAARSAEIKKTLGTVAVLGGGGALAIGAGAYGVSAVSQAIQDENNRS